MGKDTTKKSTDEAIFVSPIASPLASDKLLKKLLKTAKKASKEKSVRRGVKEVVKAIRKGEKGLVLIAADVSPVDVISHIPVLCEEAMIKYIYVNSRLQLGEACGTKRPTSMVMVVPKQGSEFQEGYDECSSQVKNQQ